MPNAMIAQGFLPIGRDLPEIGGMLYAREREQNQDARRNRLLDLADARDEQRFTMQRDEFERKNALLDDERLKAQEEREIMMLLPAVKAGDPQATAAVLERIRKRHPEAAAVLEKNPAMLGLALDKLTGQPGPVTTQAGPNGSTVILQDGRIHSVDTPPRFAPDRPSWQQFTDEKGLLWERDNSGMNRPRPVMGPDGKQLKAQPRGSSGLGDDYPLEGPSADERLKRIIAAGVSGAPSRPGASGTW